MGKRIDVCGRLNTSNALSLRTNNASKIIFKYQKMLKINKILRGPIWAFLLTFTALVHGQNDVTQTLRGRVLDAVTNAGIASASVILLKKNVQIAADTEGSFRMEKIAVGRYNLSVKCIGYQSITIENVIIESGKETVLTLQMTASNTVLERFEVSSVTSSLSKIGLAQSINMETLQRVPANFNDVARMLTNVAGVAGESDAANHISVRGLSPNALQWYLEGAEIVNPNHLSNAATSSDRATQNGGGVSIFSTQVLERVDFYKGALPTDGGNALGAIVDVRFRNGNNEKKETTLGIGLVGLDVATEGRFSKKSKASYLINYRYSTVGLLSKLGVPLGDEASAFQDFSFKLHFPTRKMGNFDVFGVGGISENVFVHKKRADWLTQKDSQDITFKNNMGAIGASHFIRINDKATWESVAVLSALENSRVAVGFNATDLPVRVFNFNNINRKLYIRSRVTYQFKNAYLVAGAMVKNEFVDELGNYKFDNLKNPNSEYRDISKGQGMFYMPFADLSGKMGEKWAYTLGLRANYFSFTNKLSIEPTASIRRNLRENETLKLSYSRQNQLLTPAFYFSRFFGALLNRTNELDFIKSDNVDLTYNRRLPNGVQVTATLFGQFCKNVIYYNPNNTFEDWSMLDNLVPFGTDGNIGLNNTAQTVGIEANISNTNKNGWFWQANVTLFDASFKDSYWGSKRSLENNSRFIFNGYFGKEWTVGSRNSTFWGVGSRTILRGGNNQRLTTLLFYQNSGSKQIANYFRSDLNIYLKKNHRKWSSIVQLDIQNVTNRLNEQYYYYDTYLRKLTPQYQLGLLPNLSYRISF